MIDRKQLAIDFAQSLNHPEIEKIILFGSVARGEDTENSDIDILIITKKSDDDFNIRDDVYSKVMTVLLDTNEYLSVKMRHSEYYQDHIDYPFYINVEKEGILIK